MHTLHEILTQQAESGYYYKLIPSAIKQNLRADFSLRPYQQDAIGRFVYCFDKKIPAQKHWLFHMATGSGKTFVMAALLIYLYKKGYRNFLFFVNSTNIIEKTKDNFLNHTSSKYLFAEQLFIDGQQVKINALNNFQTADKGNINIVFTTIQGLHTRLNTPRENNISYQDFDGTPIVMISDEAHHINADTKRNLSAEEDDEYQSWEATVNKIFKTNKENLLLEFTATTNFNLQTISKKYSDKVIFDYSLKQFRKEGYSKDVAIFEADTNPFHRALTAVLLNQYRKKIFLKHKLHIKPVLLFKSKTIKDSQAFKIEFETGINQLDITFLKQLLASSTNKDLKAFAVFLKTEKYSLHALITELQHDFSSDKLLVVNSLEESEAKQIAVNTLENVDNPYRIVFAVDKLNEGWDVLNLFDIVRLYDSKDASRKTTIAEAQLIGRGARYCPFSEGSNQDKYKRKFDHKPTHELQVCETLYYHCGSNSSYIDELDKALVEIGVKAAKGEQKDFFNKDVSNHHHDAKGVLKNYVEQHNAEVKKLNNVVLVPLSKLPISILQKAINKNPFFQFAHLKQLFPELQSTREFINTPHYLGKAIVALKDNDVDSELNCVCMLLEGVADCFFSG